MLQAIVRRPASETNESPVLVLLHGLGANEHDLMGLAGELDPGLLIVSVRAPLEYGPTGYAWFEIDWDESGVKVNVQQVFASRDLLLETLRSLPAALGMPAKKMFVGGFSQGAMMSVGVAMADPGLFSGVISMSGRLVPEFLPTLPSPGLVELPFLVQHGTQDQVLPATGSQALRDYLQSIGAPVTYQQYRMSHEINQESLAAVRDWLVPFL